MKSIFIDSYQIHSNSSDIGVYVSVPIQGLDFPQIRQSSFEKAGEHGAYINNVLYGGRLIVLQGKIYGSTVAVFEAKRREFVKQFGVRHDSGGRPIEKTLKLTTMTDLNLQIPVYIKDFKMNSDNLLSANFQLQLVSGDFALVSQTLDLVTIFREGGGGVVYPVIYPVTYGASLGGANSVSNSGSAPAYPVFTFHGQLTNPILRNTTTGKFFKLETTINDGEYIAVDIKNKTVVQGGVTNKIGVKSADSEWFLFETGTNNITLDTTDSSDDGYVEIQFRESYLSI